MAARLRVTLRRSIVGTNPSARGTVRALGLRHIGHSVELTDDPAVRGQVRKVRYLVEVEEVLATSDRKRATSDRKRAATSRKRAATSRKEEAAS